MTTTQKLSTLHIACGGNGCDSCDNGRVLTAISVKANNPSEKQIAFYARLAREAIELASDLCALQGGEAFNDEILAALHDAFQAKLDSFKSKTEMSAAIDDLISSNRSRKSEVRYLAEEMNRRQATAEVKTRTASRAKGERSAEDVDGMYQLADGRIVKVQYAVHGSGKPYAKLLVVDSDKHVTWEYTPGLVRECTPDRRMTLEQAKAFGALYGACCNCGRTLTDERSIEAGIGPVCARAFA